MALTQEELLDIWRSVFDESYTIPLEDEASGRGFDVIAAIAAVMERIAASVETTTQAMYIGPHSIQTAPPAAGEAQATGALTLRRAIPTNGDIDLLTGDPLIVELRTQDDETVLEINLEMDADLTLPDGTTGPYTALVKATRPGYQGNVPDTYPRSVVFSRRLVLTAVNAYVDNTNVIQDSGSGDSFDRGMVGAFVRFLSGVNAPTTPRRVLDAWDAGGGVTSLLLDGPTLTAGNATVEVVDVNALGVTAELDGDISGGLHGWLDALGLERDIGRNAFEDDTEYRKRVRALPDVVTKNALIRTARRILEPLGIPFRLFESRGPEIVGAAWDHSPWDDTAADVGLLGRHHFWQGGRFYHQGFYLVVERRYYGDPGGCWDHAPPTAGAHPTSAWDWIPWDGEPYGYYDDLTRLVTEINRVKQAGMPWLLVLVDSIP